MLELVEYVVSGYLQYVCWNAASGQKSLLNLLLYVHLALQIGFWIPMYSMYAGKRGARCKLAGGIQLVSYTANEGPERIQYKCMVTIYVFPEMKLTVLVISKAEL
jgi:hypothetical protein